VAKRSRKTSSRRGSSLRKKSQASINRSLILGPSPSRSEKTTLKYCDFCNIQTGLTQTGVYAFRANSPMIPDYTTLLSTHDARFFDMWTTIYNKFRVTSSVIRVTPTLLAKNSGGVFYYCVMPVDHAFFNPGPSNISFIQDAIERPGADWDMYHGTTGDGDAGYELPSVSAKWNLNMFNVKSSNDADTAGTSIGSFRQWPIDEQYFAITMSSSEIGLYSVQFLVEIEYEVTFFDRANVVRN